MIGADPRRALEIFRAMDRLGQLGGAIAIAAIPTATGWAWSMSSGRSRSASSTLDRTRWRFGLREYGIREGRRRDPVRDHRGFVDATFGTAKAGARVLYLNTDFAGPQLRDVCEREESRC